jgi:flagellar biosynthesis protein FlhB
VAGDLQKTEKPTAERRRKAREQGTFARARDAGGVVAGLAAVGTLAALSSSIFDEVRMFALRCFRSPIEVVHGDGRPPVEHAFMVLGLVVLPTAGAAALGAVATGFVEAGFQPRFDLVLPNFGRLDPMAKLKTMLAPGQVLFELLLALARVTVVGYVVYATVSDDFGALTRLSSASLTAAAGESFAIVGRIAVRASFALAALAAADYVMSRRRIEQQLMMSRQEIKDEHKQLEGDPRVKARLRARARERLKRALVKQVKKSDVVVTNPTHVSVALRYRPREGAPIVTAKGYDDIAMHIREIAKEHGINIIRSPALARALASRVRVGRTIPVDLYAAVAEVLAFVYRLRGRRWN